MSKTSAFFDDLNAKIEAKQTWSAGVAFKRSNPLPIDSSSVYETKALAENYVSTSAVVYPGQVIAYADGGEMVVCVVQEKSDSSGYELKKVGIVPSGDAKTVSVTATGVISLLGSESAGAGTLPMLEEVAQADGSKKVQIVWKTLEQIGAGDGNDNTTYKFELIKKTIGEGESAVEEAYGLKITPVENGVDGTPVEYKFDVYTKAEVDAKLALIDKALESYATISYVDGEIDALEEAISKLNHFTTKIVSSTDEVTELGILYLIKDENATGSDKYNEYLYIEGQGAVLIGDTSTDLSGYYTSEQVDNLLSAHTTAADGKYATKEYVGTIPTDDKYKDLTVIQYVNKKAEETLAAAQGGSSETAASVKQQLDNYKSENDTRVGLIEDSVGTLQDKVDGIEAGAQVNVIEKITLNGAEVTPNDKLVALVIDAAKVGAYSKSEIDGKVGTIEEAIAGVKSTADTA